MKSSITASPTPAASDAGIKDNPLLAGLKASSFNLWYVDPFIKLNLGTALNKAPTALDAGINIRPVLKPSSNSCSIFTPSIKDSAPKAVAWSKIPPPFFVKPEAFLLLRNFLTVFDVTEAALPFFKP